MIKTFKKLQDQEKERYTVPRTVHDYIPVSQIFADGIFRCGSKFTKSWRFTDINYLTASREDKESMFLKYSELLNSLDSGATAKITINNRSLNRVDFDQNILIPDRLDALREYRQEYNDMLIDKAADGNNIMQEKYITVSVCKRDVEEAREYFARVGAELENRFRALGSQCRELDVNRRLRILHDFYRKGDETAFQFDLREAMRRGHDFRDYICPDSFERFDDYIRIGDKYARVLFLKEYATYIKDSLARKLPIHYLTATIQKEKTDDEVTLSSKLTKAIVSTIRSNFDYFSSFDQIIVYYDKGQVQLTKIIVTVFTTLFANVEMRKVSPSDYRLFQVADLFCIYMLK